MPDRMVTASKPEASKLRMKRVGSDQKNWPWEKKENHNNVFWFFRTTGNNWFGIVTQMRWIPPIKKDYCYKQQHVFEYEHWRNNLDNSASRPSLDKILGWQQIILSEFAL